MIRLHIFKKESIAKYLEYYIYILLYNKIP